MCLTNRIEQQQGGGGFVLGAASFGSLLWLSNKFTSRHTQ